MSIRKIGKAAGSLALAITLLGAGYWWGQQDSGHSSIPNDSGTSRNESQDHSSHELASGTVNVSAQQQQLMGIRTTVVQMQPLVKKIRTVGVVTYDETRVAHVYSKVDGWIEKLLVNYTGKLVKKGQPLFTLYSPDLVSTQEEYLLALQAKESLGSSSFVEIRTGAASLLEATRRRLRFWDIADEEIREVERTGEPKKFLTIFSPLNGFVIKKAAIQGMKVMPDRELYTIADLSTVWVNADIYEFDLPHVRLGQKTAISLSYYPGRQFTGRVSWISPVLDEKTRTTKVRLEFPNHDFMLKPEMYANVEIEEQAGKKLAVPDEAVLDSGLRKVVFVANGPGRFAPQEVKLGGKFNGFYEVLSGLSSGTQILASASFLLDSESRLKEAMGAMAGMEGHGGMKAAESSAPVKAGPQEKKTADLVLSLSSEPSRPRAGENTFRLKIADRAGTMVKHARVDFVFQMNMRGMVPAKAEGKLNKEGYYEARGMLSMAGEWEVVVTVRRPGHKDIQENFKLIAQ